MNNKQNDTKGGITQTVRKFAILGAATVFSLYAAQTTTVFAYNSLTEAGQEAKMVNLYNDIWMNIHKSDMDKEINEYKKLAENMPTKLKVNSLFEDVSTEKMKIPTGLPLPEEVEQKAKELSDKTRIKIRRF